MMMAAGRTIKPELFKHVGLFEAEIKHGLPLRVAFPALLLACCDREGRFRWCPKRLKLDEYASLISAHQSNHTKTEYETLLSRRDNVFIELSTGGREAQDDASWDEIASYPKKCRLSNNGQDVGV